MARSSGSTSAAGSRYRALQNVRCLPALPAGKRTGIRPAGGSRMRMVMTAAGNSIRPAYRSLPLHWPKKRCCTARQANQGSVRQRHENCPHMPQPDRGRTRCDSLPECLAAGLPACRASPELGVKPECTQKSGRCTAPIKTELSTNEEVEESSVLLERIFA